MTEGSDHEDNGGCLSVEFGGTPSYPPDKGNRSSLIDAGTSDHAGQSLSSPLVVNVEPGITLRRERSSLGKLLTQEEE